MSEISAEARRQKIEKTIKVLGLLVGGFVVAPFVFIAIKGLIGLGIAAVLGLTIVYAAPVVGKILANWRLKALKAEAARSPVEDLQNQYAKKEEALRNAQTNLRKITAEVLSFTDEVAQYVKDEIEDAELYKQQLAKMRKLLDLRNRKYQEAKETLAQFAETIRITDRRWKMACSAAKMSESMGELEGDAFDKICIETSLGAVQTKLNEAFADLEISLLDDDKEKAKQMFANKRHAQSVVPASDETVPATSTRQKIAVS